MQSLKEKASNVAASAKSGMEKTKATVQEKVDRMKAHDPTEKEMATERKEERVHQAELNKQATQERNAAIHQGAGTGTGRPHYSNTTTGSTGHSTGMHQMSALPGHGTGEPMGRVTEGVGHTHPIGTAAGTQRASAAAHNTQLGTGGNQGYGTGGVNQGYGTGGNLGYGTDEPMGQFTEGVTQSHPIGTATGTQRASAAHNTQLGGGANQGYGTGGGANQGYGTGGGANQGYGTGGNW